MLISPILKVFLSPWSSLTTWLERYLAYVELQRLK